MTESFTIVQSGEVYGLYHYMSRFSVSGNKYAGSDTSKVYNFKKFGTNAKEIKRKIEEVAKYFGCDKIVACPAHVTQENELQILFGKTLERTKEVLARKYNHKADIDAENESQTISLPDDFSYKRVLLVDDICTTGKTLRFYRALLKTVGVESVLFAVGISEKLEPKKCEVQLVYQKEEPKSVLERSREHEDEHVAIDKDLDFARKHINWPRRNRAEKSLTAWINAYCVGVLINDPPPEPHGVKILDEMEEAVGSSRPYQILVARGGGKTSYTECCAAYAIATGRRKFCLISSINAKQAQQILRELTAVFMSEPFATDYPDIALPIKLLDGHGRRSQRQTGHDTKVRIVTDETMLPTITMPDGTPSIASGACVRAKALKSVRGTKNGTQRPDLVILDDLQTREIAENDERVKDVLNLIRGDVMGLAGKGKAAIISTATTIAADDLTEQLAADPSWKTTRNPAILKWPAEWAKKDHGLWGEYFAKFDEENAADRKHTGRGGSLSFYKSNRKAMDAGADILNWDNYSTKDGQISGLQKLMDKYHEMGAAAFLSEYQMEPQRMDALFEITPKLVLSRVRPGTVRGDTIENCVFTAAATDINPSYALSTTICRFDLARSCFVTAYFVQRCSIDSKVNDTAYNQRIFDLLAGHVRAVRDLGIPLNAYGVDCGGKQWEAVTRFAIQSAQICGVQVTPMAGRAGRSFNPNVKTRIRDSINDTVFCRDPQCRVWLAFNTDSYREQMQRSWGAEPGSPGGCSLYDGGVQHSEFAIQISNERLIAKQKMLDGRVDFRWRTKEPHDFGDCLSMCYALAGARNISGGTAIVAPATPAQLTAVNSSHDGTTEDGIVIGCDF